MIPPNATPGCGEKWFGCPCVAHITSPHVITKDTNPNSIVITHITEYVHEDGYVSHDEWTQAY